jgi:bifunctional non-homologous end joining protein LigD
VSVQIEGQHVTASGHSFELSNMGKVLFPGDGAGDGITKGELVEYYAQVADAMLPYLKDRPIAMARYPDGITKQRIFQKNPGRYFPDWITSVEVKKEGGTLRHVVCDQAATLVYLANQAVIEFHVFLSRVDSLECADQVVWDFDPPGDDGFDAARQCALWLRELVEDELGLTAYVKTTGGKGLHVHVPLNRKQGFEETRTFAREAAQVLATRHPDVITVEQRIQARGHRVYADVMRDAYAQTVVAPWTVRARPGAHVATPLHWSEVENPSLSPGEFTLRTAPERLATVDDPWSGMSRRRYDIAAAHDRLRKLAPK